MKKIFTKLMLLAVAAAALVSCVNNLNDENPVVEFLQDVTLTAEKPTEVRTELIGGVPYWSKGDKIGVYTEQVKDGNSYAFENTASEASLTATFKGQTAVVNTLFVYYPYTANGVAEMGAKVDIPVNQEPTATSFDGKADIMLAKPVQLDAEGTQLNDLEFARLGAIVKVVLKDNTGNLAGQHVSALTMTAESNLVGRVYIDVVNQELGELYYGGSKSVNATYTEATQYEINSENATYLIVYPQTLAAESKLTIEAATEGYAISKEISLPKDYVFESGKVTTLTVNLFTEHMVAAATGLALPFEDDFAWVTGTTESQVLTTMPEDKYSSFDKVYPASTAGAVKLGTSSVLGWFTTVDIDLSQPFTVLVEAKTYSSDTTSKVEVTVGEQVLTTETLGAEYEYYALKFDAASAKEKIQFKVTGKRGYINYLQVVAGHDYVLPPVLTVSATEISGVSHEGEAKTFTYSVANPVEGTTATVTDNVDWITTADNNGTVTVTVAANEAEEAREGVVTVTYGDLTKTVTVKQNAKPAEGGPTTYVDVLDRALTGISGTNYGAWSGKTSNSAAVYAGNSAGDNDAIQLRSNNNNSGVVTTTSGGKARKIVVTWQSSTASGRTLNIYGKNSAYSAATDLYNTSNDGDKLGTIVCGTSTELVITGDYEYIGFRSNSGALYLTEVQITWESGNGGNAGGGETPEEPATPVLSVNPTTLSFDAAAGSKTIACTIENEVSGQNVTATENVDWLSTLVSGKTVTITATANTGAARTATVTIAYTGAESKTVTVSQAEGNTGGGDEPEQPATKVWTLVKSASEIAVGDQIIIAASGYNYAISTTQSSNNRGQAAITKSGETLATPGNTVQILTVQAGSTSGTFAFYAASPSSTVGYLYCASTSSKNYLRTQASVNAAASWTIAVASNGVATIKSQISGITRNLLSYNQQSSCFACYSSVQKDVVIYKLK